MSEKTQPQRLLEAVIGEGAARDGDHEWRLIHHAVEGGATTYTIDLGTGRVFVGEHKIAAERLIASANAIRERAIDAQKEAEYQKNEIPYWRRRVELAEQRAELAEKAVKAAADQIEQMARGITGDA